MGGPYTIFSALRFEKRRVAPLRRPPHRLVRLGRFLWRGGPTVSNLGRIGLIAPYRRDGRPAVFGTVGASHIWMASGSADAATLETRRRLAPFPSRDCSNVVGKAPNWAAFTIMLVMLCAPGHCSVFRYFSLLSHIAIICNCFQKWGVFL